MATLDAELYQLDRSHALQALGYDDVSLQAEYVTFSLASAV